MSRTAYLRVGGYQNDIWTMVGPVEVPFGVTRAADEEEECDEENWSQFHLGRVEWDNRGDPSDGSSYILSHYGTVSVCNLSVSMAVY